MLKGKCRFYCRNAYLNYLFDRTIRTVDGTVSGQCDVTLGVPTGSVYGSMGYIMLVNSVVNVIRHCKVYIYADDMCLLYSAEDLSDACINVQNYFGNITNGRVTTA